VENIMKKKWCERRVDVGVGGLQKDHRKIAARHKSPFHHTSKSKMMCGMSGQVDVYSPHCSVAHHLLQQ
jgi:hypothetical protein